MERQTASIIFKKLEPHFGACGMAHAELFGSVARGHAMSASDVNILLAPTAGAELSRLKFGALNLAHFKQILVA